MKTFLTLLLVLPIYALISLDIDQSTDAISGSRLFLPNAVGQSSSPNIPSKVWNYFFGETLDSTTTPVVVGENKDGQSIISRYDQLYDFFRGDAKASFDSLSDVGAIKWDAINNIYLKKYETDQAVLDSTVIFGWHPYWMGNAFESYNFNLLSHVSFYGYIIDPNTGLAANDSILVEWQNSTFMETAANSPNTKVLLTVANYGEANNRDFFYNALGQQQVLIDEVLNLLASTGAQGIDLNFENIRKQDARYFTSFVRKLKNQLKTQNKEYLLTLSVAVRDSEVLEIKKLQELADFFVLMGYGFQSKANRTPGPIAPLYAGTSNLNASVKGFLNQGLEAGNLVLGLPYYGGQWRYINGQTIFDKYLTYRQIQSRYDSSNTKYTRPDSLNAFHLEVVTGDTLEVWFDDQITLQKKYSYAKEKKLRGVGIWALGYDNGYLEMWQLLEKEFAIQYETVAPPTSSLADKFAVLMLKYKELLVVGFVYILCFLFLGFAISLNYSNVREALFNHNTYRVLFVFGLFTGLVLLYLLMFNSENYILMKDPNFTLIIGLILGFVITNSVYFLYRKWKERLPEKSNSINWHKKSLR